MTSTELQVASKPLANLLSDTEAQLRSALAQKPLVLAEFAAALDNAVAQDAALAECVEKNPSSVRNAILTAAMLGLRPGPVHKHFALTCFKVRGKPTCVGIPEWRGYVEVANQAGELASAIVCDVVYEHELKTDKKKGIEPTFGYDKFSGEITQEDDILGEHDDERTPDKLVAVYATCKVKGRDGFATVVLNKREVERRRGSSAAWKSKGRDSLWGTDPVAMWKKTAMRALLESGKVPMSRNSLAELHTAEMRSDAPFNDPEQEKEVVRPAEVVDEKTEPKETNVDGRTIVESDKPPEDESVIWKNTKSGKTFENSNGNWVPCEVL